MIEVILGVTKDKWQASTNVCSKRIGCVFGFGFERIKLTHSFIQIFMK
jgi:hypothetical protein